MKSAISLRNCISLSSMQRQQKLITFCRAMERVSRQRRLFFLSTNSPVYAVSSSLLVCILARKKRSMRIEKEMESRLMRKAQGQISSSSMVYEVERTLQVVSLQLASGRDMMIGQKRKRMEVMGRNRSRYCDAFSLWPRREAKMLVRKQVASPASQTKIMVLLQTKQNGLCQSFISEHYSAVVHRYWLFIYDIGQQYGQIKTQIACIIIFNIQSIMDFKLRESIPLQRGFPDARPGAEGQNNSRRTNQFSNDLRQKFTPMQKKPVQVNSSKGRGLDKFIKKAETGAAPKNQFKKYMLEGNNVFYQNRSQLKQLEDVRLYKWALIVIWLFLSTSYFIIGRLETFKGICPKMAKCGVFIRCPEYYELSNDKSECILSSDLIDEIQQILESQVYELQRIYGTNECNNDQTFPSLNAETMFDEAKDIQKAYYYKRQALKFFRNTDNQINIGFQFQKGYVFPTKKIYSLACQIQMKLSEPGILIKLLIFVVVLLAVGKIGIWVYGRLRISNMYNFLKEKVMAAPNKLLNVTHAMPELESSFGPINEEIWAKINDLRAKERQIGYFQDDFLYWKMSA